MTHAETPFPDAEAREPRWLAGAAEQRGGPAYGELIAMQRLVQDRVAGAVLPPELVPVVTQRLRELADLLGDHQAPEKDRWDGWRPDLPGRAMPLLPPYLVDNYSRSELHGRITFTRFYLGGGAAAHGGAHTLLFDDLMGFLANMAGGMARTAYLTINYRRITPLDVELTFDCTLDGVEGRKRFVSARLYNPNGEVVADCTGMFLRLLPGQQ